VLLFFTNPDLQTLYTNLVTEGIESRTAALTVGARIEELDIQDLNQAISLTNNEDISIVYQRLLSGSGNHLRAFNRQLVNETGQNYSPIYITEAEFLTIINAASETGQGNNNGMQHNGNGGGNGQGVGGRGA
jgi:hypothetical protein